MHIHDIWVRHWLLVCMIVVGVMASASRHAVVGCLLKRLALLRRIFHGHCQLNNALMLSAVYAYVGQMLLLDTTLGFRSLDLTCYTFARGDKIISGTMLARINYSSNCRRIT